VQSVISPAWIIQTRRGKIAAHLRDATLPDAMTAPIDEPQTRRLFMAAEELGAALSKAVGEVRLLLGRPDVKPGRDSAWLSNSAGCSVVQFRSGGWRREE
jgi:hypothetical protein